MKRQITSIQAVLLITVAFLASGCAALKPVPVISTFGEVNVEGDKETVARAKTIVDTADVRVISGSLPGGLVLEDQSSKLVVLPDYESKYKILGSVEGDYMRATTFFERLWYPSLGYDEKWRVVLCYPQAPLNTVLVGLWGVFSPTAWPCGRLMPGDEGDRKLALIDTMKKGTKAAGGNLLIVTGDTSLQVTQFNRYGDNLGTSVTPAVGLKGFIVKEQ